MVTAVRLPKFGETMRDATIGKWYKNEGDKVEKGEPLVQVETEKFTIDVEAPASGIIRKIIAAEGSVVVVGELLGIIAGADEEVPDIAILESSAEKGSGENSGDIQRETAD